MGGRPYLLVEPERTNAVQGALTDADANNIPDGLWAVNGAVAGVDMFLDDSTIGPGMMARWNAISYAGWQETTFRDPSPAKAIYSFLMKNENESITDQILFRGQTTVPSTVYEFANVAYTSDWTRWSKAVDLSAFTDYLSAVHFQLNTSVGSGVKYLAGLQVEYEADWASTIIFGTAVDTVREAETCVLENSKGEALDVSRGTLAITVCPLWSYDQPTGDLVLLDMNAGDFRIFWDQSAAKWAATVGGVTFALSAAAETFAAETPQELIVSWQSGVAPTGRVGAGATQTGGSAYTAPAAADLYLGSDSAGANQIGAGIGSLEIYSQPGVL